MTTTHAEFLELAAAAIDFELSEAERQSLSAHLAGCIACRRRLAGLEADQRAIAQLPGYALAPAVAQRIRHDVRRRTHPAPSSIRMLAV
ncbi:MAG: anti-sigma factor family protein, partial [Candidatus Limnocylindrales bacterium]